MFGWVSRFMCSDEAGVPDGGGGGTAVATVPAGGEAAVGAEGDAAAIEITPDLVKEALGKGKETVPLQALMSERQRRQEAERVAGSYESRLRELEEAAKKPAAEPESKPVVTSRVEDEEDGLEDDLDKATVDAAIKALEAKYGLSDLAGGVRQLRDRFTQSDQEALAERRATLYQGAATDIDSAIEDLRSNVPALTGFGKKAVTAALRAELQDEMLGYVKGLDLTPTQERAEFERLTLRLADDRELLVPVLSAVANRVLRDLTSVDTAQAAKLAEARKNAPLTSTPGAAAETRPDAINLDDPTARSKILEWARGLVGTRA